jgi:C1A family cysteine protease
VNNAAVAEPTDPANVMVTTKGRWLIDIRQHTVFDHKRTATFCVNFLNKHQEPEMKHVLDWNPRFDERSKRYAAKKKSARRADRVYKRWTPPSIVLDQGKEGACVGFGATAAIMSSPGSHVLKNPTQFASGLYKFAKFIDQWEGERYVGTSVLAGLKSLQRLGFIKEYRWCFKTADVIDALLTTGPVVVGIPWYESMYETKANGLVEVGGAEVGGHCLLLYGYNPAKVLRGDGVQEVVYWRNSWGPDYGVNGTGYVPLKTLDALLRRAEAAVPIF